MPPKKMLQQMEGYHLPKNDTEEAGLVNKCATEQNPNKTCAESSYNSATQNCLTQNATYDADASNANDSNANASNANASYANASYANASYANASYPNASNANASYANASYPNASYANASYPNASYANANANANASYANANASYANALNAKYANANASYANASNANASYANASYANALNANASNANASYANASYANANANASYANALNANASNANAQKDQNAQKDPYANENNVSDNNDPESYDPDTDINDPESYDQDFVTNDHHTDTNETVHGSFNQGHTRFGKNSGRQCVANSAMAMMYNQIKDISTWDSYDLDTVLCRGNKLYEDSINQRQSTSRSAYLLVSDICPTVDFFGKEYRFVSGDSLSGFVMKDTEEIVDIPQQMCLDAALQTIFSQHDATFMTFGGSTFAVIERNNKYHVFDSHSRNTEGLQVTNGTSILIQYTSLLQVYEHCLNLARSMNLNANSQFEMTGMRITTGVEPHDNRSDNASDTNDNDDVVHIDELEENSQDVEPHDNRSDNASDTNDNDDVVHIDELEENSQDVEPHDNRSDNASDTNENDEVVHIDELEDNSQDVEPHDNQSDSASDTNENDDVVHIDELEDNSQDGSVEMIDIDTNVTVHGSFNQGHTRFGKNSGRQCVANSAMAMMYNQIKDISTWDSYDLDTVLCRGNKLYEDSINQRQSTSRSAYLLVSDICPTVDFFGKEYRFLSGDSLIGFVMKDTEEIVDIPQQMCLDAALQTIFSQHDATFMTFGGSTFAVIERNNKYHVFDSHSRNTEGLQVTNGTSILIQYTSLLQVYEHCLNLARSMNLNAFSQFEMTGMKISTDIQPHDNQSENASDTNDNDDVVHIAEDGRLDMIEIDQSDDTACETNENDQDEMMHIDECDDNSQDEKRPDHRPTKKPKGKYAQAKAKREYMRAKRELEKDNSETLNLNVKQRRLAKENEKYNTDLDFKNRKKLQSSNKYKDDEAHREFVKKYSTNKYATVSEHKETVKAYSSQKYATDSKHREDVKTYSSQKYATDSKHKEDIKSYSSQQYRKDAKHKEALKNLSSEKYAKDEKHRENKKNNSIEKYANDEKHRESVKTNSTEKYANDEKHRENVKTNSTEKYANDEKHRESVKTNSTEKYANDEKHRESVKTNSTEKYAKDEKHRENVKTNSIKKYAKDAKHRESVKSASIAKYKASGEHRTNLKERQSARIENCPLETVKEIVDRNKAMFEKDGDVIDEAEELFDKTGQLEDAWAQICPETESERIACEVEHTCTTDEESESETAKNMPDLLLKDNTLSKTEN
ncbi:uncharacterized protein LOC124129054 [Haliotis rufescens]|uniref:uncharacterized protein LOC124129054 n=1 Tax=Haliotis rufescens TaxID=6454 RepID=UPI00201F8339|nr:uncharacterized protein LOC124129054 [Haliotis rufescens]